MRDMIGLTLVVVLMLVAIVMHARDLERKRLRDNDTAAQLRKYEREERWAAEDREAQIPVVDGKTVAAVAAEAPAPRPAREWTAQRAAGTDLVVVTTLIVRGAGAKRLWNDDAAFVEAERLAPTWNCPIDLDAVVLTGSYVELAPGGGHRDAYFTCRIIIATADRSTVVQVWARSDTPTGAHNKAVAGALRVAERAVREDIAAGKFRK